MRLLRSELFRLRRRWMPWVLLLMVIAASLAIYLLVYFSVQAQLTTLRSGTSPSPPGGTAQFDQALASLRPGQVANFGLGVVDGLGSVLLIVLTASVFGNEFNWGTLRAVLALGTGRVRFLAAKYVTMILYAILFTMLGVLAAVAGSEIVSSIGSLDRTLPDDYASQLALASGRTIFTFLPYIALAAFIAVWSKSAGAGIAIGLVVYFAEGIVTTLLVQFNRDFTAFADYGLSRNVGAINRLSSAAAGAPAPPGGQAAVLPEAGHAALVLVGWTVLLLAVALWRFRTRDVTSG
ncbi:MAG: ABC transporter permease subunit [Candidatus Limnocylindria bacterium]